MKTLTVRLPDSLVLEIESESGARRVSKSVIVRERLGRHAMGRNGGDLKEVVGRILEEAWKAKVPAGPPRFRSPQKRKLAALIRARHLHR